MSQRVESVLRARPMTIAKEQAVIMAPVSLLAPRMEIASPHPNAREVDALLVTSSGRRVCYQLNAKVLHVPTASVRHGAPTVPG